MSSLISLILVLTSISLLSVLCVKTDEEVVEIEITSSGDAEIEKASTGWSETGPRSQPPIVFRTVEKPPSNQYWVSFINESPDIIELVWDDGGREGILQATIQPHTSTSIGTYEGHVFYFRYPNTFKKEYVTNMKNGKTSFTFKNEETRIKEAINLEKEKKIFMQNYLNRTGRAWKAYYPRYKPIHYMYSGDYIGQKHAVTSNHSFYNCYPVTNNIDDVKKCRNDENVINFEWEIVSTSPRVMWLSPPFLSDFEIEHIKLLATPKLTESTVGHGSGAYASSVRTSLGCFIDRCETDVMDWIFRRIADVTQVEESFLWHMVGSENLQVLKYEKDQQFKPHPDYNTNREQMRYLTFLLYLNTLNEDQGGATTFPLANLSVTPKKGHVAAFYSILEDGNVDYMSLHSSTPIKYGVKWSAPVWIWDPSQS